MKAMDGSCRRGTIVAKIVRLRAEYCRGRKGDWQSAEIQSSWIGDGCGRSRSAQCDSSYEAGHLFTSLASVERCGGGARP